jgi:hypothetical protein
LRGKVYFCISHIRSSNAHFIKTTNLAIEVITAETVGSIHYICNVYKNNDKLTIRVDKIAMINYCNKILIGAALSALPLD